MPGTSARVLDYVRECQWFAGHSSLAKNGREQLQLVGELVRRLPAPADHLEGRVFRGILIEVAAKWAVHVSRPRDANAFPALAGRATYWSSECSHAKEFEKWATAFIVGLERTPSLSPVERARSMIDERFAEPLSIKTLARMAGTTAPSLRSAFKKQLGVSVREYRTRVRVRYAARLLAESRTKVDAIAVSAGFRSKRNFYSAFRRVLGCTPSDIRRGARLTFGA